MRDTPISEAAIVGAAVGAAAAGLRPVAEVMIMDFISIALDQLVNHAAKARFMSGGLLHIPLTLRTAVFGGIGSGATHSQTLEAWLAHVPGLKVVVPSTPADAKGLLTVVHLRRRSLRLHRERRPLRDIGPGARRGDPHPHRDRPT